MPEVVVIGAGISGLTAALRLHGAGVEVCVVERPHRPGGRVHSVELALRSVRRPGPDTPTDAVQSE